MEEIAAKEARGKRIEIWFQDEARIRQKNKITRRWAKRGTRPPDGKGAGLVLPSCISEAMALHLEDENRRH